MGGNLFWGFWSNLCLSDLGLGEECWDGTGLELLVILRFGLFSRQTLYPHHGHDGQEALRTSVFTLVENGQGEVRWPVMVERVPCEQGRGHPCSPLPKGTAGRLTSSNIVDSTSGRIW